MYKVVLSDLDGTLLKSDKTVSQNTLDVLRKINDKGVIFIPSTGRAHTELPPELMGLDFLHYAITFNGGGIYDYKLGKYIYEKFLTNQLAQDILELCKTLPVVPSGVVNGRRWVIGENGIIHPHIVKVAFKALLKTAYICKDMKESVKEDGSQVQKLMIYPLDLKDRQMVIDSLRNNFSNITVSTSGAYFIEVTASGATKGNALKEFCRLKELDIKDTMAFGDAENDISLLDAAGHAVVMENGTDETKAHSDVICGNCDNEGLSNYLKSIYGI